jgi:hypothetical protein
VVAKGRAERALAPALSTRGGARLAVIETIAADERQCLTESIAECSLRVNATAQIIGLRRLVPTAVRKSPRSILVYFNEVDRGGHFAAWEEPELFSEEMRAEFKSMR